MSRFGTYTCGTCGGKFPDRDDYLSHLEADHPETWLARRVKAERAIRERQAAKQAAVSTAAPEIGENGTR